MQERVDKYIYIVNDNRYRVKFLKVSKKDNIKINFDQYVDGTLEDAKKVRDDALSKAGISLEEKKETKTDIFDEVKEIKERKPRKKAKNKNKSLVDKYIYEIEKGKKYRIFIRKGATNGQLGDYYSEVFNGTLAQARKNRDEKLAEMKLNRCGSTKSNIRFVEFAKIYYKEYAEKECSPTTVQTGKDTLRRYVLPVFANVPLNKIDALSIQRLMNKLKDQDRERLDRDGNVVKLSPTTVNGVYRLIRKILNKAIAWDYLDVNPVTKVKTPGTSKKEKQSYNKDELLEILDMLKTEDAFSEAMFTISICTGIRKGELMGLHLEDINYDNNTINVKRAVVWDDEKKMSIEKDTKTKGSVREVPIPQFCADAIKEYLKLRKRMVNRFKLRNQNYKEPLNLFISEQSGGILYPGTPSSKWLKFRRNHPEIRDISLHGLRHSYCSLQMNENHDLSPADVQKLMGHSQLSTTFIYTHSNEDKNQSAVAIFNDFYSNKNVKEINLNQLLSLYTKVNFTTQNEIDSLLEFCIGKDINDEKYNELRKELGMSYSFLKNIDLSKITISNMFEFLDDLNKKYGNSYILKQL